MAHKKAAGSSKNGRDSQAKRLGVKEFGDRIVPAGSIIVRQRGTAFRPGLGVTVGRDHTIMALTSGTVQFAQKRIRKYDGRVFRATVVNIVPSKN